LGRLDEQFRVWSAIGRPELYQRGLREPASVQDPAIVNGGTWRAAEVPAVDGHGSARGVAAKIVSLVRW
jgi:hypothetical protein